MAKSALFHGDRKSTIENIFIQEIFKYLTMGVRPNHAWNILLLLEVP